MTSAGGALVKRSASPRSKRERLALPAGVGGVHGDPGRDDLVQAVERVVVQRDVATRDQVLQLVHRPRPDDGRGHSRVGHDKGKGEVSERHPGAGSHGFEPVEIGRASCRERVCYVV